MRSRPSACDAAGGDDRTRRASAAKAAGIGPGETLVLPVGLAEDDLRPVELRLPATGHALVVGTPRAGVSEALALLARQARAADPDAIIVAVGDDHAPLARVDDVDAVGPAEELDGDLGPVLAKAPHKARRWVVLVDDAPLVGDPQGALAQALTCRRPGLHVIAGGHVDELRRGFTHWTRPMRASRTGLLLDPNLATDGDVFGVKLPRRAPVDMGPGRGFVIGGGQVHLAHIAQLA